MRVKCARCRKIITKKSAFVLVLRNLGDGQVYRDVVRFGDFQENSVALHMNGDRLCGNTVASFRSDIEKILGISDASALSELDLG